MSGKTLVLSRLDVKELLTMDDCVPNQEEVFALNGQGKAWNGQNVWFHPDPKVMATPGVGKLMSGGIEPDWRGFKNLAGGTDSQGVRANFQIVTLFRADGLLPVAIVEAKYVGMVRTGAGAGVATKYLARKSARVVGVVGTGDTARYSLLALHALRWPVSKVYVYSRSPENRAEFVRIMGQLTGYPIEALDDPEPVTRRAEILITGTASPGPAIKSEWVQPGTHVNCMGKKTEVDPTLFLRSRNVADEVPIALEDGKLGVAYQAGVITAADAHASLGEVMVGKKAGRTRDDEITVFDSSGLTIQDLAACKLVWELAQKRGMGTSVELHHRASLW